MTLGAGLVRRREQAGERLELRSEIGAVAVAAAGAAMVAAFMFCGIAVVLAMPRMA